MIREQVRQLVVLGGVKPLARAIGIDKAVLSKIKNGIRTPSADVIDRVCEHFGVRLTEPKRTRTKRRPKPKRTN